MSDLGRTLIDAQPERPREPLEGDGWPEVYAAKLPASFIIAAYEDGADGRLAPFLSEMLFHGLVDEAGARVFDSMDEAREFTDRAPPERIVRMVTQIAKLSRVSVEGVEDVEHDG